jgi:hypothetical protein
MRILLGDRQESDGAVGWLSSVFVAVVEVVSEYSFTDKG